MISIIILTFQHSHELLVNVLNNLKTEYIISQRDLTSCHLVISSLINSIRLTEIETVGIHHNDVFIEILTSSDL